MPTVEELPKPDRPRHVVAICGGAVAGSEAAALCAERGALAVVLEQNERPYGKIEDGLPRWHVKLRKKEYEAIDANLAKPGVYLVPGAKLGRDIGFDELRQLGFSAVVMAHGAWRDRPLPIPDADKYVGKGLAYQNPLVYWFNHYTDEGYDGPWYDIPQKTIVVGGGLASIDVVKIVNLELYGRALRERGIETDMVEMEVKGIDKILERHGIAPEELGIDNVKLFYRRRKQDMPLASMDNPSPEQKKKLEAARVKIMDRVQRKYLVELEDLASPVRAIDEDGRMAGLVFRKNEIGDDGRPKPVEGSEFEVRANLVVSSIGSIPEHIEGVPMKGELYQWRNWETGELVDGVYGLGNVLTGKGNIKDSRQSAKQIMSQVIESYLGLDETHEHEAEVAGDLHAEARERVKPAVDAAMDHAPIPPERQEKIFERIRQLR